MATGFVNLPAIELAKYPSAANLPTLANDGDQAIVLDTYTIYVYSIGSHTWVPVATPGASIAIDGLTGDVTATGPGVVPATVAFVGGKSAADVAAATATVDAATSANTPSTLVLRDGSGNFAAGTITATTIIDPGLTANTALIANGSKQITSSVTTSTELSYVSGVTSAIQTQLNGKQATLTIGNLTDAGTDGIVVTGGTGAVIGSGTSIAQHVADTTHNGYLSSTDWNTFNSKQSALSFGNLTDTAPDGITVTNGTGAVIGSGTSISQQVADASNNGYLSSTDWNTFNAAAGSGITALTGDATATGPGSVPITLATVNGNVGSFGTASAVGMFTVNGKGLITGAANTSIQIAESQVTNLVSDLASKVATASLGNLTDAGTDGIVVTGGTGAVVGSVSLAQHVADATHNGYLSSTDFNTFSGKQSTITIGALDAQAENANGLALVSNVLSSQSADATHPGMVNNTTQTFSGAKTFSSPIVASLTGHASLDLALTGGTMSGAINMGSNLINAVTDPVSAQDAATKNYVDTSIRLVDQLSGDIEVPANKTYTLALAMPYAGTINTLKIQTSSGTCTVAININGSPVTGISAVSVSSSIATGTASAANTFVANDTITLVVTSAAIAQDMAFTLKVTRA